MHHATCRARHLVLGLAVNHPVVPGCSFPFRGDDACPHDPVFFFQCPQSMPLAREIQNAAMGLFTQADLFTSAKLT